MILEHKDIISQAYDMDTYLLTHEFKTQADIVLGMDFHLSSQSDREQLSITSLDENTAQCHSLDPDSLSSAVEVASVPDRCVFESCHLRGGIFFALTNHWDQTARGFRASVIQIHMARGTVNEAKLGDISDYEGLAHTNHFPLTFVIGRLEDVDAFNVYAFDGFDGEIKRVASVEDKEREHREDVIESCLKAACSSDGRFIIAVEMVKPAHQVSSCAGYILRPE